MAKIETMSTDLANKIAAGEVVEKCMNVVKELVENSIDANADIITIELQDSGVRMIKVTDNGIGMDRSDAVNCFNRHATSKLHSLNDLFNIKSLGFRGEALPSIASVSKVILRTSDGSTGTEVIIDGGILKEVNDSDARRGTEITVSNLFYNTPVRLKYLKSLYTELSYITTYVNQMALGYPNIKFVLVNNDKELLNTEGSGNLLKVINNIYGLETAKKMMEINNKNKDFEIIGYMSYPEASRSNRNAINILVNNRTIKNNEIIKTIIEAYHTYEPEDRYPVIVLNIILDPFLVDCNVHPTKMDVKFSKIEDLKLLIKNTIESNLAKNILIPEISINTDNVEENIEKEKLNQNYYQTEEIRFALNDTNDTYFDTGKVEANYGKELSTIQEKDKEENKKEEKEIIKEQNKDFTETPINKNKANILPIIPVGKVYNTYIVGQNELGMYLIDQHAAAERINYEKTYKALINHENNRQTLLIPITIELSNSDYLILKEHFDILDRLNFEYEEFGINTIVIRSHPTWLIGYKIEQSIKKIIEIIIETEDFSERKFYDHISMTMACKMSIKAHNDLTEEDINYILENLIKCDNPYTCPHGRPTIITYTKYDLEKLFKRAM